MRISRRLFTPSLALALAAPALRRARAEASQLRAAKQYGLGYLQLVLMEDLRLVEKHAQAAGLGNIEMTWATFRSSDVMNDALISGTVDFVCLGLPGIATIWSRTRGNIDVRGAAGLNALPLYLLTRNPAVRGLRDFTDRDRIALPAVRVSMQAILLQMACARAFGADQWARLDGITVQLGHPDAAAALANPNHEVNSHFSAPPFFFFTMRALPNVRAILRSPDIIGGPLSQAQFFTTTRFAEANPRIVEAVRAATLEAIEFIRADRRAAVEIYRSINNDRTTTEDLLALLDQPGMMDYIAAPQGTMKFAEHLNRAGTLRTMPRAWTDYYLPIAHDLPGS